jgi:hypothetical protein
MKMYSDAIVQKDELAGIENQVAALSQQVVYLRHGITIIFSVNVLLLLLCLLH